MGFYGSNDQTNSVKALKEDRVLRIRLQSHQEGTRSARLWEEFSKKTLDNSRLIKHRKLKVFGHICMMKDERLVKTVMVVMVEGDRPRERPARR